MRHEELEQFEGVFKKLDEIKIELKCLDGTQQGKREVPSGKGRLKKATRRISLEESKMEEKIEQ